MSSTTSPWKKIRYRIEWIGVLFMARLIPLFSRKMLLRLAKVLGWLGYHLDARGRTTAIQNLEAVFENEKFPEEIRDIALGSFQNFARTVCDHFWTPRLTRENFRNYCHYEVEDDEAINAARGKGSIWVTPHYGNFEWLALTMGFFDYPLSIVAQDFKNPLLADFFKKNREFTGHTLIPRNRAMIRLFQMLKKGTAVALLCDLTVPSTKAATVINCMGFKTCVTPIHAEFARRLDLPVFPGLCIPQDDGNYNIKAFPALDIGPQDTAAEIAQKCWDVFEPHVRAHPEHWIWMYKHWRFRPIEGGENYPPYANPTSYFSGDVTAADPTTSSSP